VCIFIYSERRFFIDYIFFLPQHQTFFYVPQTTEQKNMAKRKSTKAPTTHAVLNKSENAELKKKKNKRKRPYNERYRLGTMRVLQQYTNCEYRISSNLVSAISHIIENMVRSIVIENIGRFKDRENWFLVQHARYGLRILSSGSAYTQMDKAGMLAVENFEKSIKKKLQN